jgi:hypothetical protein
MASSFKLALEWLLDFVQLRGKVRNMPQWYLLIRQILCSSMIFIQSLYHYIGFRQIWNTTEEDLKSRIAK